METRDKGSSMETIIKQTQRMEKEQKGGKRGIERIRE
jgi:hypothetical protein